MLWQVRQPKRLNVLFTVVDALSFLILSSTSTIYLSNKYKALAMSTALLAQRRAEPTKSALRIEVLKY